MSEQTLQALLAERVTAFANSDKPVEIIDEHVKKMFTSVIDSCFGRYGEMGKQVEEAIKSALPANRRRPQGASGAQERQHHQSLLGR